MLDIRFLRENPEVVKQNIRNKFQEQKLPLVDEVIALDLRNREIKMEVEGLVGTIAGDDTAFLAMRDVEHAKRLFHELELLF